MRFSRPISLCALVFLCAASVFFQLHKENTPVTAQNLPEPEIQIPAITEKPEADGTSQRSNTLPALHASYACVTDADSLRCLYGKKSTCRVPMASTTKIMTSLLALEHGKLSGTVTASAKACSMPKVHLGMSRGEQFRLKDLLYSLMLESHNDTAVAIAEHISGSVEKFAKKMNRKARKLGMADTHFVTPNGLDAEKHYSTPEDMCRLAAYAIKNRDFLSLISTKSYSFSNLKGTRTYSVVNRDAFLSFYDGALGIKTGFTSKAGYCFVGAAERNGITLTSCVLACGWPPNKSYKWSDTAQLMDYGFSNFTRVELPLQNLEITKIPVEGGKEKFAACRQPEKIHTLLSISDTLTIRYKIPEKLCAPVKKDTPFGTVSYYINGVLYRETPVYPASDIAEENLGDVLFSVLGQWMSGDV